MHGWQTLTVFGVAGTAGFMASTAPVFRKAA